MQKRSISAQMDLRSTLLRFVASPDRAWLVLLGGTLLIARECVAPGRVVPGLLGGIMFVTAGYHLPSALPGLVATVALLYLQARYEARYLPSMVAAVVATATARQAGAGWPAALASVPVIAVLAYLIRIGMLAHKKKVSA
jgi:hypothetical protein